MATSQGDSSAGSSDASEDLLPSFAFGGAETTLGGVCEPNVAVYPPAAGATPYPSGVAGTPGPLDGYCPDADADANDDGQGHPYVTSTDGASRLYTLQRQSGDNSGIGLLVHGVQPEASDPLAGVPAQQSVGVDPNTFATEAVSVPMAALA